MTTQLQASLHYIATQRNILQEIGLMDDIILLERDIRHLSRLIEQLKMQHAKLLLKQNQAVISYDNEEMLKQDVVMRELHICKQTVYNMTKKGLLKPIKVNNSTLYRRSDIEKIKQGI